MSYTIFILGTKQDLKRSGRSACVRAPTPRVLLLLLVFFLKIFWQQSFVHDSRFFTQQGGKVFLFLERFSSCDIVLGSDVGLDTCLG